MMNLFAGFHEEDFLLGGEQDFPGLNEEAVINSQTYGVWNATSIVCMSIQKQFLFIIQCPSPPYHLVKTTQKLPTMGGELSAIGGMLQKETFCLTKKSFLMWCLLKGCECWMQRKCSCRSVAFQEHTRGHHHKKGPSHLILFVCLCIKLFTSAL